MKKVGIRFLSFILTACMIIQLAPSMQFVSAADKTQETYIFAGAPGNATVEKDGWVLSVEHSSPGIYFSRFSTGWFTAETNRSLLYLDRADRGQIAYNLYVENEGYYDVTIKTASVKGDYTISVNGKAKGKISAGSDLHSLGHVYFRKGLNTFKIEGTAGTFWLYSVTLNKTGDPAPEEFTLDFSAEKTIPDIHSMTFATNGLRFSNHISCRNYAGFTDLTGNNGYARVCFNAKTNNFVGFDFLAKEAGNYDVVVMAEDNYGQGAQVEVLVNGTTNEAKNGTSVGVFETSPNKDRTNKARSVHLAGTAPINKGYNTLHFKSVGQVTGADVLYFREGISLVNPVAAQTVAGRTMNFTKGAVNTVNVKAPSYGLYFIYIKGKVKSNGFGGNVTTGGTNARVGQLTQYIDFSTGYYDSTESENKEVTRVIGPVWLNGNTDYAVDFTETYSQSSSLELSGIELHEVKQNLWMKESNSQPYAGVSIVTHGWEIDEASKQSNANRYLQMMLGLQVADGVHTQGFSNAHRDANGTNINVREPMQFKINVPVAGIYSLSGMFKHCAYSANVNVSIDKDGKNFLSKDVELYSSTDEGIKNSDLGDVSLDAGVYTLTFKMNSTPSSGYLLYMKSLTFAPITGPTGVRVNLNSTNLTVGETIDIFTDVAMSDGSVIALPVKASGDPANEDFITVESSDTDVVTVTGNKLTAHSAGQSAVIATAYVAGKVLSKTVNITVSSEGGTGEFKLYTSDVFPIRINERRDILLQGAVDNIVTDLNNAQEFIIESDDDSISTGEIIRRDGKVYLRLFAWKEGETQVDVTCRYADGLEDTITVTAKGSRDVESTMYTLINFGIPSINDFRMLDANKHGWELDDRHLNDEEFWAGVTGPTILYQLRTGRDVFMNLADSKWNYETNKGQEVYFNIKVDKTGWYALSFAGQQHFYNGAVVAMYIDDEYVGEFNFSDPDGEDEDRGRQEARYRDAYLTEGIHSFKIQRINAPVGYRHSNVYMHNLKLTPVAEPVEVVGINVECAASKLTPGDEENINVSLRLADGTDYHFPNLLKGQGGIKIESVIPERASYAEGVISAKAGGDAMLKITVDRPGEEPYIGYWKIPIADGQIFDFTNVGMLPAEKATIAANNWCVDAAKTSDNIEKAQLFDLSNDKGLQAVFNKDEVLALTLNVLKKDAYDIDLVASQVGTSGCRAAIYLGNKYLGEVDFSSPDGTSSINGVRAQLNSIELEAGENTLYIKRISDEGGKNIYINRLVLSNVDTVPEFSHITIDATNDEIVLGETMQASASIWMTNGRKLLVGESFDGTESDSIEYSSGNTNVFTVDSKTGLITSVGMGKTALNVKASVGGEDYTHSRELSVIRVLGITADEDLFLTRTETAKTSLSATLDDEAVDFYELLKQGEIEVICPAGGYVNAQITKDDEQGKVYLVVEGLRAGTTSVTVKATVEGVVGYSEIPVQIYAPTETPWSPDLDFVPGYSGSPDSALLSADGWCVNYEMTSPGVAGSATWNLNSSGLCAVLANQGTQLVLDYMVKEEGCYSLDIIGKQWGDYGATIAIYFDDMYLGEFSFAHPTDITDNINNEVREALNSLYMSLGTHRITIERVNDGTYRHSNLYLLGFDFTKLDGDLTFKEAQAKVGSTTLSVGESTDIFTQAIMSDGSVRRFGNLKGGVADTANSISVTNSNPYVAEIRNDGRLYAKQSGTTTVTVKAMVDGEEKSSEIEIEVDDSTIDGLTAKLAENVVYVGKEVDLVLEATAGDRVLDNTSIKFEYSSTDEDIVTVVDGKVTGVSAGTAYIDITAMLNGYVASAILKVEVTEDGLAGIKLTALPRLIKPDSEGTQIVVSGGSFHGQPINLDAATITFSTEDTDIIELSDTGYVKPKQLGSAVVKAVVEADVDGYLFKDEETITIIVTDGKVGRTYYTDNKVEAARENIQIYGWAKSEARSIIKSADKFLDLEELLWNTVTTQELPRGTWVGYRYDPWGRYCRYCDADLTVLYSNPIYAYNIDAISSPWKIQCKECRRKFPSNDFGSFYKLGIVEGGQTTDAYGNTVKKPGGYWSYEQAHQKHFELFAEEYAAQGYSDYSMYKAALDNGTRLPAVGYLKNDMYPDVAKVETLNHGNGMFATETVEGWGVDDGYGYRTGYVHTNTNAGDVADMHTYIAAYNRSVMGTDYLFDTVVQTLSQAYLFTGDKKYGRVCAIVLDRLADVYPDMDIAPHIKYYNSGEIGKLEGRIWENDTPQKWAQAYDAVWDLYDDPQVISFLNKKAEKYNMENDKSTPEKIRQNIEDGILREIYKGLTTGQLHGNFGLHQVPLTVAAIVLDNEKDSTEMFDYLMRYDKYHLFPTGTIHTGGEILHKFYNDVDRDGGTKEGLSPNYQNLWYNTMGNIAKMLNEYENYNGVDLYTHPKLSKMIKNQFNYIMCRRGSLPIGDSSVMASLELITPSPIYFMNMYYATGDYEFLQMLYFMNKNSTEGLNLGIWAKNPEKVQQDMRNVIDEYGEYDLDDSRMMPGTGFMLLRDGSLHSNGRANEVDTQRTFWMGFGLTGVHGHRDTLGIGLHAYGLDFAPDFGYPNPSNLDDQHRNWGMSPLSHNLVIVDDKPHSSLSVPGTPLHFDDAGRVKVMEAENPTISSAVDIYRRAVVMVEVDDDISYGVDFFRIKGGNEHLYSFHSQSHQIGDWSGFMPIKQEGGSYAGKDVPYQSLGHTSGYSYLTDVRRDDEVSTGEIMVEFDVTDYREAIKDSSDMHLRLTMLNDFNLSDVSLAKGVPPKKEGNPEWIEFLLARRSGTDLDTTFTTVLEPYKGEPNITSSEQVSVRRADGKELADGEVVRAIKVGVRNERYDYIVYASENDVEYIIDDRISFCGFIGVCTEDMDGNITYSYVNHGTKMGAAESVSEYTGAVVDFTRDPLEFNNTITVSFDSANVDVENLKGRFIYVENDGAQNAVYPIEDASVNASDNTVTLEIGNNTLVREATNITSSGADCTYNIAPDQWFSIPLSGSYDSSPVFAPVQDATVATGAKFTTKISATGPAGKPITLSAKSMPRGASFDAQTGTVTWVPDAIQVGDYHFAIEADDGVLKSVIHFKVSVHKSIVGPDYPNDDKPNTDTDNNKPTTDTPAVTPGGGAAGGGGSGGGAAGGNTSTDKPEDTKPDEGETEGGNTGDTTGDSEKFIDLGSHNWAKDAIYALVEKGVVNGTSANTYSPAKNIKRADFAIMLTRAFKITEGETEQFADVDSSKYYAEELRLAKAAGIVAGIGDNKFNPEGEISRQDMMLMLYRALKAQGYELSEPDYSVLADFADAALISDYAKDAVAVFVKDGIIGGANGKINPKAQATRAEIAVMLNRVIKGE